MCGGRNNIHRFCVISLCYYYIKLISKPHLSYSSFIFRILYSMSFWFWTVVFIKLMYIAWKIQTDPQCNANSTFVFLLQVRTISSLVWVVAICFWYDTHVSCFSITFFFCYWIPVFHIERNWWENCTGAIYLDDNTILNLIL